jgi:RNase P subunit RPR2
VPLGSAMIRIVCPSCHTPLSTTDLEQVTIDHQLSLVCPDCAMVLLTELAAPEGAAIPTEATAHA